MSEFHVSNSKGFREELGRQLSIASKNITILSGYVKAGAVEWLQDQVPESFLGQVTIVTRWAPQDLISGSSDLTAFSVAEARGWRFRIHKSLHAKCTLVDNRWISVGSANITRSGLGIGRPPNVELTANGFPSPEALLLVRQIIDSSAMVTAELVAELASVLGNIDIQDSALCVATQRLCSVIDRHADRQKRLKPDDLFETTPASLASSSSDERAHDLGILGGTERALASTAIVSERLPETRIYRWLAVFLDKRDAKSASFGEITQALHNELTSSGPIRRTEVKRLLGNTLEWIEASDSKQFVIIKHRRSVSVAVRYRE